MPDQPEYTEALGVDALAADGHYILIDKSNAGDVFGHSGNNPIAIKRVWGYILGLASANIEVKIGCIVAITGVDSTIKWIAAEAAIAAGERVQLADLISGPITPELGHVSVGGAGSTLYETGNTDYDTGTTHKTPYDATGSTIAPAVGDIVMSVVVTAGTVDLRPFVEYSN